MSDEKKNSMPEDRFNRKATFIRVVDGDTIDVEIDLGWSMKLKERLRLSDVDTPEMNKTEESSAGKFVRDVVTEFFQEKEELIITSEAYDRTGKVRGKFGRTIAEVYRVRDGASLNQYLLAEKLGWPTDKTGKIAGKRSLAKLTGIPKKHR